MAKSPYDNLPVNNAISTDPITGSNSITEISTPIRTDGEYQSAAVNQQSQVNNPALTTKPKETTPAEPQYIDVAIEEAEPEEMETVIVNSQAHEEPSQPVSEFTSQTHESPQITAATSPSQTKITESKNQISTAEAKPATEESAQQILTSTNNHHSKESEAPTPTASTSGAKPEEIQSTQTAPNRYNTPPKQKQQVPHRTHTKTEPMPKPPQYSKLSIKNRFGTDEYILPFEESLLVPDTMPDMAEILFAEGRVNTVQPTGNKYEANDFISGDITFYTVFRPDIPEASPVDVIKSAIPFKTDKCWGNNVGCTFRATVTIKSISAERINERKFIAKGELAISITKIAQQELTVFKESPDLELICLHDTLKVTDLDFETEETTEISQEINLKEDQPAPTKILKESIEIIENHKQITSGKLVINAVINSTILYLGDDAGETKLCSLTSKTDFTQFVPVKEHANAELIDTEFISKDLKMTIAASNEFQLQGQVKTLVRGYVNKDIQMISDAYHKSRNVIFDLVQQPLSVVKGTVAGEISAREVINIDDNQQKPARLICGSGRLLSASGRAEGGRIIIEGSVMATILAFDEDSVPFTISSTIPLRGSLEMSATAESPMINVNASIKEFWFDEINSRQIEVNISTAINVWVCQAETFTTLENLCFAEVDSSERRVPMAIYVTGRGDTLWDIAKRYKSDANDIAELNQIDLQRPLSQGMKLLIMK